MNSLTKRMLAWGALALAFSAGLTHCQQPLSPSEPTIEDAPFSGNPNSSNTNNEVKS